MAETINFNYGRDWTGYPINKGRFTLTTWQPTVWTQIDTGGDNAPYTPVRLDVMGEITSPASFASGTDRQIYLEIGIAKRGSDTPFTTFKVPLIYFKASETSTTKEMPMAKEIFLNTQGKTDGNLFVRIIWGSSGFVFTNQNFYVTLYGNYDINIPRIATFGTTNNLRATAIAASCNTVEVIPAATLGTTSFRPSSYGYLGDSKDAVRYGLSRTTDPLGYNVPRYCFDITDPNSKVLRILENSSQVLGGVAYAEGDVFLINRTSGGAITYKKNGTTIYTSAVTDTLAMVGHSTMVNSNSRILGVRLDIGAGEISPTFENLVNVVTF
jgi:hypothetical protein